ncbi:MAG: hypothetical protein JKY56_10825, partial [Kofleriaceae bacterium]|nr:hypothetical protein [Kofleriaceae bacterium]
MQIPANLGPLVEQGLIQEVIRPLRSGKEAQVYLVLSEGEVRVAKVYKEAHHRSFKHRSDYTEGRRVRNSRDQRAMRKQSKYGKSRDEEAWRSTEADIIFRLRAAGVTVPEPFAFVENVLIMELVRDSKGEPASRLADIHPSPAEAQEIYDRLLSDTVKMLCAGVVHGDLGEYNVLMSANGPVIIDFPQAIDPAVNRNARRILLRDVTNLDEFLTKHTRKRHRPRFGAEMWSLFEKQLLEPDTRLTGRAPKPVVKSGNSLLEEMEALEREARERREALGLPPPRPARAPIFRDESPPEKKHSDKISSDRSRTGRSRSDKTRSDRTADDKTSSSSRRRRRRPKRDDSTQQSGTDRSSSDRSSSDRSSSDRSSSDRSSSDRSS